MDIEQIKAFLIINETKNFTKAAEILHIAQSTITSRIRTLEQLIGKQLFTRNNKQVSLTRAGELFLPFAERIYSLAQTSIDRIQLEDQFRDKLVIGGPSSIWNFDLNKNIFKIRSNYPEIALDLMAHTTENTIQKVIDGTIDIGIVYSKPRYPMLECELLQEDFFVLVGSDKFKMVDIESLNSGNFLFLDWGNPFMRWFKELVGPRFIPAFKINQTTLVVNYLISGSFFAFVPKSFVSSHLEKGEIYELNHQFPFMLPKYTTYLIYLKSKKDSLTTKLGLELLKNG
jgi:DNA-binding transcriptional LysR family regulator